eukprot:gene11548-biopygen12401
MSMPGRSAETWLTADICDTIALLISSCKRKLRTAQADLTCGRERPVEALLIHGLAPAPPAPGAAGAARPRPATSEIFIGIPDRRKFPQIQCPMADLQCRNVRMARIRGNFQKIANGSAIRTSEAPGIPNIVPKSSGGHDRVQPGRARGPRAAGIAEMAPRVVRRPARVAMV